MRVVPLQGQAFFWCRPEPSAINATYNVTWIYGHDVVDWSRMDRIVYDDGRPTSEPNPKQRDGYHFMSQDGKEFLFIINNVTKAAVA